MVILFRKCLKGIWCCSFNGYRNFAKEKFLGGEHLTSSSTKTAQRINFKLCTHISNRLLHKTVPAFFLIMSHSFFIAIIRRVLKAYFAWKQLKVDYSKNIRKEENRGHGFVCLLVGYISVKKIIENCNSVGAGAQNIGKVVSFWPNFDPNFTNIWRVYKGILYILKKVGLSICKEIL